MGDERWRPLEVVGCFRAVRVEETSHVTVSSACTHRAGLPGSL